MIASIKWSTVSFPVFGPIAAMNIVNLEFLLLFAIRWTQAEIEIVWIEDTNGDHDLRHMEMGLPQELEFNLKRLSGGQTKLKLHENKRLNANAPVFTTVSEDGIQKAIQVESKPILGTKFYHDKGSAASLKVSCKTQRYGPCKRFMEGSLDIEGDSYQIKPSTDFHTMRYMDTRSDVPHVIEKVARPPKQQPSENGEHVHDMLGIQIKGIPDDQSSLKDIVSKLMSLYPKDADKDIEEEVMYLEDDHNGTYPPTTKIENRNIESDVPPFFDLGTRGQRRNVAKSTDTEDRNIEASQYDYKIPPDVPPFFDLETRSKRRNDENSKESTDTEDRNIEASQYDYKIPPDVPPFFDLETRSQRGNDDNSKGSADERAVYDSSQLPPRPRPTHSQRTPIGKAANLKRSWHLDEQGMEAEHYDYKIPPEERNFDEKENLNGRNERSLRKKSLQKRQSAPLYTVEVLVTIDPSLWKKYYDKTSANNGMNQDEATMYALRERFAHVISGVSLMYETIDDPDMNIYFAISGFLFYKTIDSSNPLKLSVSKPIVNGVEHVDSDSYISSVSSWAFRLRNLPNNDHIMVMTAYELYSGNTQNKGVEGIAYTKGACGWYRLSVLEDSDYYFVTTLATHEIGHNLGAEHDGSGNSASCPAADRFIMNPFISTFTYGQTYNVNRWRFSTCSIGQFKTFVTGRSASCLQNTAEYYDGDEWEKHTKYHPGELYTPDQQCKQLKGEDSYMCKSAEDESICRFMTCYVKSIAGCRSIAAARGTPCGIANLHKWCMEGLCITREMTDTTSTAAQTSPTTTTTTLATTTQTSPAETLTTTSMATKVQTSGVKTSTAKTSTTTQIQETTSTMPPVSCTNKGWRRWSCKRISKYFYAVYSYPPSYWCQDTYWKYACCALCEANPKQSKAPTISPSTTVLTTTEPCVDVGYYTWSCAKVSRYFKNTYRLLPKKWCLDPDWNQKCCAYCADNGK